MDSDFPKIGINTAELLEACNALILKARNEEDVSRWGVNWADIGVSSVEYRKEILLAGSKPYCAVIIEEAAPESELAAYVYAG